jgi:hypothetical protein
MNTRLMSEKDLEEVTRKKRSAAQAAWFKREFNIEVVRRGDGTIVLTWSTFEALQARKAGLTSAAPASAAPMRPPVYSMRKAAA